MSPISATCWPETSEMNGSGEFLNALRFMTIVPVPSSDTATRTGLAVALREIFSGGRHRRRSRIGRGAAAGRRASGVRLSRPCSRWQRASPSPARLHEDGLADTADGFGGGWSVEKRLAIMKDSRIGAYGALALCSALRCGWRHWRTCRYGPRPRRLIAAHAAARITPAFVMNALPYAGDTAAMKVSYSRRAGQRA